MPQKCHINEILFLYKCTARLQALNRCLTPFSVHLVFVCIYRPLVRWKDHLSHSVHLLLWPQQQIDLSSLNNHQLRSTIPLFPPSHNHSRLIFAQIVLQGCCTSAPDGSLRMTHEKSIPKGDAKKGKDLTLMVSWRVSQSHPYEWGPNLYLPLKFPPAYFRKADDPWTTAFHLPCWIHQFKQ